MIRFLYGGLALSLLNSLFCLPVYAWGFTGHMVIAKIAFDHMRPQARQEAERLTQYLSDSEPKISHFIPAAVWMDAVRWKGLTAFDHWHYQNNPFNPHGLKKIESEDSDHIVWAIKQAQETLANPESGDFQKALMLRILIHTVGDIHQPLHALSRFSLKYPKGDQGGNLFPIKYPEFENLHSFWDSAGGLYPRLSYENWQQHIPPATQNVLEKYPLNSHDADLEFAPNIWIQESYQIGVDFAYPQIRENHSPSPAYIQTTREICQKRISLAASRLTHLLNQLLEPKI